MNLSLNVLAVAGLSGHAVLMLIFATAVFGVFAWDRFQLGSVCLAVLILLPALFFIFPHPDVEPYRFFSGFGHPALVAICALMVLGHALVLTGALEPAARRLAGLVERSPRLALLAVLLVAAGFSGVMNDTPVVVLLMPLLIAALQRAGRRPGFMLMPMNFAVLIGGMSTTIGTSTNLIVVALAAEPGRPRRFRCSSSCRWWRWRPVPGLLYLWLVAPWLLRHADSRRAGQSCSRCSRPNCASRPTPGSMAPRCARCCGAPAGACRCARSGAPTAPWACAAADGHLARRRPPDRAGHGRAPEGFRGQPEDAAALAGRRTRAAGGRGPPGGGGAAGGHTRVTDGRAAPRAANAWPTRYGLVLIGLRKARGGARRRARTCPTSACTPATCCCCRARPRRCRPCSATASACCWTSAWRCRASATSWVALGTLAAVVVAAGFGGVPIALAALVGVLVLMATRALAWREVGGALSVNVVLIVAASLALGDALTVTGATGFLAQAFVSGVAGWPPLAVLAALMGLIGALTNFVSNNAAAAIGTPLAIEVARLLGLPAEPYVLAVLFGCNLSYVTPMAYQTNLLVMHAAGYTFRDFVRVGGPLFLIMWAGLSLALAGRYGLATGL